MNKGEPNGFFEHENLMSPSIRAEITGHFISKAILKNQFLLTSGKIADEYLFLEKGFMRAFAYDTQGNEITTNFYGPGQMVFEVSSFFNRTRSMENIQALTDCEGRYITYKQLNQLFHALPQFREFGRSILVKGFSDLKTRMTNLYLCGVHTYHVACCMAAL